MASTAPTGFAAEDSRRILHAVFRVGNLDKTVQLYKDAFGMQLLRERDVPEVRAAWWLHGRRRGGGAETPPLHLQESVCSDRL